MTKQELEKFLMDDFWDLNLIHYDESHNCRCCGKSFKDIYFFMKDHEFCKNCIHDCIKNCFVEGDK